MSTLSYSLTDLSPEHQPPHQHLRYVTSSSFGSDWNSVLHSHDCTELFYVTDGEAWSNKGRRFLEDQDKKESESHTFSG